MDSIFDWLNKNQGVVAVIIFIAGLIIAWISGFTKRIISFFKSKEISPSIKAGKSIRAGKDIIVGNNNIINNSSNKKNSDLSISSDTKRKKEILLIYLKKHERRSIKELTKDLKSLIVKKDVYNLIYFYPKIFNKQQVKNQGEYIEGVGLVKKYRNYLII